MEIKREPEGSLFLPQQSLKGQFQSKLHRSRIARERLAPLLEDCVARLKRSSHKITLNGALCVSPSASDRAGPTKCTHIVEIPTRVLRMIEDVDRPSGELYLVSLGYVKPLYYREIDIVYWIQI
jgi:hypothetical protein